MENKKEWVKISEASRQCQVPRNKIYQLIDEGKVGVKGNGIKFVNIADVVKALQGAEPLLPVEKGIGKVEIQDLEQANRVTRKRLDLEEKALDAGFISLSEFRKTIADIEKQRLEADRLLSQAKQTKKDTETNCETMISEAKIKLQDIKNQSDIAQSELKGIQDKIDDKYQEADTIIAERQTEAQAQISESLAEIKREWSQVRMADAEAQKKIQYANSLNEWLETHQKLRQPILEKLGNILYAMYVVEKLWGEMSIDTSGIKPLIRQYEQLTQNLKIIPLSLPNSVFKNYETSLIPGGYGVGQRYKTANESIAQRYRP